MLGIQVKRKWRTPQPLSYFFYCFGSSHQKKVKYAWTLIILFLMLWVLKSRESEGRLNYCHTFSIALGTQIKIKWVTSLLSYFFYCLGHSSHKKVEDVSSIMILFLVLWVLTSRESGGRLNYYHTFLLLSYSSQEKVENVSAVTILFLLLWVFKSRESEGRRAIAMLFTWIWVLKSRQSRGRLSYKGTFSIALDTQIKRMCRTSQPLPYFSIALGTRVKRTWRTSQLST